MSNPKQIALAAQSPSAIVALSFSGSSANPARAKGK